jgi:hypothetical protein
MPRTRDARRLRATLNGTFWQVQWFGPQGRRLGAAALGSSIRGGQAVVLTNASGEIVGLLAATDQSGSSSGPLHQRLRRIRYHFRRSDCYRLERLDSGREAHPLKNRAFAWRSESSGLGWPCHSTLRLSLRPRRLRFGGCFARFGPNNEWR